jgi:hypothetical protein
MIDHLKGLNPQQRAAVTYGMKPGKTKDVGPLLVMRAPVLARPKRSLIGLLT